jgi:hypothetical protein
MQPHRRNSYFFGCEPQLILSAEDGTVSTGGSTAVTAEFKMACNSLEDQSIDFRVQGDGSISPSYGESGADGQVTATFTAGGEAGTVSVIGESTVSWYPYTITASAGGVEEEVKGPLKTKTLTETAEIIVEDAETWTATLKITGVLDLYPNINISTDISIDFTFSLSEDFYFEDENGYHSGYGIAPIEGHAAQEITTAEISDTGCDRWHITGEYAQAELLLERINVLCWKETADQDKMYISITVNDFEPEAGGIEGEFWYVDIQYEYCDSNINPTESRLTSNYLSSSHDSKHQYYLDSEIVYYYSYSQSGDFLTRPYISCARIRQFQLPII